MARLHLRVSPGAGRTSLEPQPDGAYHAYLGAHDTDGQANRALLALLCTLLQVPRSRLSIIRGTASRHKVIEVDGLDDEELRSRLHTGDRALGPPAPRRVH